MDKYDKICSAWKALKLENRNDLENCLESFKVLFAYHSGRIENDQITYDDTRKVFDKVPSRHTPEMSELFSKYKIKRYVTNSYWTKLSRKNLFQ